MNITKLATFLILIIIIIGFTNSCKKSRLTTIDIKVKNIDTDTISYYISKNGIGAYPIWGWKTIYLDSNMSASIECEISSLNTIIITPPVTQEIMTAQLFIKTGENYSVVFNPEDSNRISIKGNNYKGQQFLTDFYNSLCPFCCPEDILYNKSLYSDTVCSSIIETFEKQKSTKLEALKELYSNNDIDKSRYKIISDEINYMYIKHLLSIIMQRSRLKEPRKLDYLNVIMNPIDMKEKKCQEILSYIYNKYPINNNYILLNLDNRQHIMNYLWYKSFNDTLNVFNPTDNLLLAKKYLTETIYELYFAQSFSSVSFKEPFDSVEKRFEKYKILFPESKYTSGIEEILLPRTKNYYIERFPKDISFDIKDLDKDIIVFDNYKELISLEQIIKKFKGKVIYIDFWASWCGPCVGEFENFSSLHEYAMKNDITLLYISIDQQDETWLKIINKYKLSGYHARTVTKQFRDDLDKYKVTSIPRYMIVDKNGEIVVLDAERPSSKDKLYNQINKYVK